MNAPDTDTHDRLLFEFERTEPRASYMVCSDPALRQLAAV